jgi:hypothetical protein
VQSQTNLVNNVEEVAAVARRGSGMWKNPQQQIAKWSLPVICFSVLKTLLHEILWDNTL